MTIKNLTQATCFTGLILGNLTSATTAQVVDTDLPPAIADSMTAVKNTSDRSTNSANTSISAPEILATPEATFSPRKVAEPAMQVSPRFGGTFTTGAGIGYSDGFGSIEGFVPLLQNSNGTLTFLEGRLLLPTDGNLGGNLVLGHRIYDPQSDRIYGGYVAYDHRDTGKSSFNQIGLGLEMLEKSWDLRANAYFPVGDTRQLTQETTVNSLQTSSNPFFQQNSLAVTRSLQQQIERRFAAAMTGVDLEAGVKLANLGQTGDLRGYAGIYYYDAPGGNGTLGWRSRVEARPNDTLRLGLALSSDDQFGTNLVLSLGMSFPGTRPHASVLSRLGESVVRNANIVVDEQRESELTPIQQETVALTNSETGQPLTFQHVDLGMGTGNGTVENPSGTLAEALAIAQPNDIVYVRSGTNSGIPAFTIPDGVQVLSSAPAQQVNTTELGVVQLPLSGTGVSPTVQGTVTLGNNTTLSGFAINPVQGSGITGTAISNITVRDNAIANSPGEGILLNSVNGQVVVVDNTINNSNLAGFSLNNNQGQVELNLARNTINNNGDGVNIELRNTASGNLAIADNIINQNNNAGGIASGMNIKLFDTASVSFEVANNTISDNQLNGITIDLETNSQGTFNINNNTISGNQATGVAALLSNDAKGTFNLDSNTIANNQLKGTQFIFSDRTTGTVNLTNNTIANNQNDGVYLQQSDSAQNTAKLLGNSITNNGNYGVFATTNGTAQLQLLINNNQITSASSGVSINTSDSANTIANISSNTLTDATFSDLEVFTNSPDAKTCLQPRNNTIDSLLVDDSFGGEIQIEAETLPTNTITNSDLSFWSGATVAPETCSF